MNAIIKLLEKQLPLPEHLGNGALERGLLLEAAGERKSCDDPGQRLREERGGVCSVSASLLPPLIFS